MIVYKSLRQRLKVRWHVGNTVGVKSVTVTHFSKTSNKPNIMINHIAWMNQLSPDQFFWDSTVMNVIIQTNAIRMWFGLYIAYHFTTKQINTEMANMERNNYTDPYILNFKPIHTPLCSTWQNMLSQGYNPNTGTKDLQSRNYQEGATEEERNRINMIYYMSNICLGLGIYMYKLDLQRGSKWVMDASSTDQRKEPSWSFSLLKKNPGSPGTGKVIVLLVSIKMTVLIPGRSPWSFWTHKSAIWMHLITSLRW